MKPATLLESDWDRVVHRLGGAEELDRSARATGAFQRPRGVRSPVDLLRLCLLYGPGGCSLRSEASLAAAQDLASVSDVALFYRLAGSADWMQHLCERLLAKVCATSGLDSTAPPARPLRIVDGSLLHGPGKQAWRLHLCYDPAAGRIQEAAITPLKEGERLQRLDVEPGEVRIADRGFAQPAGIKAVLDAGADLLVRLTWNSVKLETPEGQALDWMALFARASREGVVDCRVRLCKARGAFEPVGLRLVVLRKPPEAALKARRAAERASRKDQRKRVDERTLAAAEHLVLLTSLDEASLTAQEVGSLYRVRWQVELAIKRLKSLLHIDRLPAKDSGLARTWLHAHLLMALLVESVHAEVNAFSP